MISVWWGINVIIKDTIRSLAFTAIVVKVTIWTKTIRTGKLLIADFLVNTVDFWISVFNPPHPEFCLAFSTRHLEHPQGHYVQNPEPSTWPGSHRIWQTFPAGLWWDCTMLFSLHHENLTHMDMTVCEAIAKQLKCKVC